MAIRDERKVYLRAPRWALEQMIDCVSGLLHDRPVDSKPLKEAFDQIVHVAYNGTPLEVAYGKLLMENLNACETRDAAQAEATRQTLRARELERQLAAAVKVGDTAWAYLEQTLRPCDADCQCVLHDFEAAQRDGVPFTTTPTPPESPCSCGTRSVLYGSSRVDDPRCPRHHPVRGGSHVAPKCAICGYWHWPSEAHIAVVVTK